MAKVAGKAKKPVIKNKSGKIICGAKGKRSGKPCQLRPMKGKNRCKFHGGMSTGAKTAEGKRKLADMQTTHGIYRKTYTEEEQALVDRKNLKCANVDDEIEMMRVQLRRTLAAQRAWMESEEELNARDIAEGGGAGITSLDEIPSGFYLDTVETGYDASKTDKNGEPVIEENKQKIVRKRTDFNAIIDRFTARLGQLLELRHKLEGGESSTPEEKARRVRDFVKGIEEMMG